MMTMVSIKDFDLGPPIRPMTRGGNGGSASDAPVVYAVDICGVHGGNRSYAIRIAMREDIADKARIRTGDIVHVEFDKNGKGGVVFRVIEGKGFRVLSASKKGGRLYFKMTLRPGVPTVAKPVDCDASIEKLGVVVFAFPDAAVVSFDRNLRAEADGKK
jgi:hypothetical protein